jgi:hypothetical protein
MTMTMMMMVPLPRTPLHKTRSLTRCQQLHAEGSITHLPEVKRSVVWEWSGLKWGCLSGDIQGLLKTEGKRHQSKQQEAQQVPIDALTLEASMTTKPP